MLPYITTTEAGPLHLNQKITRSVLEGLSRDLIQKTLNPCTACLKDAKLTPKDVDEVILVGGMTRMPKVVDTVREFFGKDPFRGVNPDEVVSVGASIQGSILSGHDNVTVLIDVVPLSLGIETQGGIFSRLINRNTAVPTKSTQVFSTSTDGQTHVNVRVFQGERDVVSGNRLLGEFTLSGIPPAPRGTPKIEVTFEVDSNSIMHVSAVDKQSGKQQDITIAENGGLSQEQIAQMIADREKYAEADKKVRELVERKISKEKMPNLSTRNSLLICTARRYVCYKWNPL